MHNQDVVRPPWFLHSVLETFLQSIRILFPNVRQRGEKRITLYSFAKSPSLPYIPLSR